MAEEAPVIWTIGHSNRSIEEFLELLTAHRIQLVADVRRFPGSRRYPHFGQQSLAASLDNERIEYIHFPELGGRRRARARGRILNRQLREERFGKPDVARRNRPQCEVGQYFGEAESAGLGLLRVASN